jgi:hypothetical protein
MASHERRYPLSDGGLARLEDSMTRNDTIEFLRCFAMSPPFSLSGIHPKYTKS